MNIQSNLGLELPLGLRNKNRLKFRMTPLYTFAFEHNECNIKVHFFDHVLELENAEALAQIGHFSRRKWAQDLINFMIESEVTFIQCLQNDFHRNHTFGDRLMIEKWINPTVSLKSTDTCEMLSIYRSYFIYLF